MLPAPKEKYDRLRELLTEAREKAGITQVELGAKLGRPQTFVSKIERGVRRMDLIEFLEIARAIGIDPLDFIEEFENR
jgi:transcriptional regulator with XRE-family HTH domain